MKTASAIVAVTESGSHLLKIDGYSHTTDVPTGSDIKSAPFCVGGHTWRISYYPNGLSSAWSDYISLFLKLDDDNVPAEGVRARHTFSLLDRDGNPVPYFTNAGKRIFTDWGTSAFIRRTDLEKSDHLRGDSFTVICDVTVMKEIQTRTVDVGTAAPVVALAPAPMSELQRDMGGILDTGEAADVAFEVDGRTLIAHRCVLAARSPVFRTELTAAAAAAGVRIVIEDMEAEDFEALLRYMYTDTLPPEMMERKGGEAAAMLPDLVAAANRYGMERLRVLCEERLREFVDVRSVAAMLAFAGEHRCHELKEACLRFLGEPENLRGFVKMNGLEHLSRNCPSVLVDLIANLAAAP
ncbi:unnamed protein product [Urochloa humidicola]